MKNNTREFWVGLFAGLGFLILTFIIFFVGGISVFKHGYTITLKFDYVSILDKGAPVRMAGVRVGEVSAVNLQFDETLKKNRVFVKVFLDRGTEVRDNYIFAIQGAYVLSEPHIEITPQVGENPLLKNGASLEGVGPVQIDQLIVRSLHIAEQMDAILSTVRKMTDDKELTDAIKVMVVNFAELSVQMKTFMHGNQEDMTVAVSNIIGFSESLNSSGEKFKDLMSRLHQGDGTVGKLLYSEEIYNEMKALVTDLKLHPWKLLKKDTKDKKFFFF